MALAFTKMHGLGNDFVVIDGVRAPVELDPARLRALADRRRGVGCDQILLLEPACADGDLRYRIFNADGREVEQCGNGARCVARFAVDQGLIDRSDIRFETRAGLIHAQPAADGQVAVDMGVPRFEPAAIPFEPGAQGDEQAGAWALDVGGRTLAIGVVSIGNPHAVVSLETLGLDDMAAAPVATIGPAIEHHPRFAQGANVGFMQIASRARIDLRVWERGVGETAACGTGACAAVALGRRRGDLDARVTVALPGGPLVIDYAGEDNHLWMTGPAETVFEGTFRE